MKDLCTQIIQSYKAKEKITCADLRQVLIHLYSCLLEKVPTEKEILQLVETAVRISEMMYLPSTQRSPKHILQLYTTEAEERLFGQAEALVSQASNRHPDVMLNMLTKLQSKQLLKDKSVADTLSIPRVQGK